MQPYRSFTTFSSAHCDDTGLVHPERYPELLNRVVEDWFDEALEFPFTEIHRQRIGIPTVELDYRIHRPGALGDRLAVTLAVTRLGERSLSLRIDGRRDEAPCLDADVALVWVSNSGGRLSSATIPGPLRERMRAFRTDDTAEPPGKVAQ